MIKKSIMNHGLIKICLGLLFLMAEVQVHAQQFESKWSVGLHMGLISTDNASRLGSTLSPCCLIINFTDERAIITPSGALNVQYSSRPDMSWKAMIGYHTSGRNVSGSISGGFVPGISQTFENTDARVSSFYIGFANVLQISLGGNILLEIENGITAHHSPEQLHDQFIRQDDYYLNYHFKPGISYPLTENLMLTPRLTYCRALQTQSFLEDYKPVSYGFEVGLQWGL